MDPLFWHGKSVFLTGHTGFKGSWLALWLEALGARVLGYALPPTSEPSLYVLADVGRNLRSEIADIRDAERLRSAIVESGAEIVIHMAAQSLVRESYADPVGTFATNVMGTVNLLEAVRAAPAVRAAVIVTSDKCYENKERAEGYREDEPMGGHDPYSSSKGCAELVTAAYRRSFFSGGLTGRSTTAIASVRAGNVIGGGDWARDRLIPDTISSFLAGRRVLIRNPAAVRPWQHVLEPLHGYLMLAERLYRDGTAFAEGWNFGPGEEDARPVSWIVEHLVRRWGGSAGWDTDGMPQPHEAGMLKLDCGKARERLGWLPRTDLPQALDWIVEWYQAWSRNENMRQFTLSQIVRYQSGMVKS